VHLFVCVKDVRVALANVYDPLWQRDLAGVANIAASSMKRHHCLHFQPSSCTPSESQQQHSHNKQQQVDKNREPHITALPSPHPKPSNASVLPWFHDISVCTTRAMLSTSSTGNE
jgi:hypothetical protein